jgi:hypothetical protein
MMKTANDNHFFKLNYSHMHPNTRLNYMQDNVPSLAPVTAFTFTSTFPFFQKPISLK